MQIKLCQNRQTRCSGVLLDELNREQVVVCPKGKWIDGKAWSKLWLSTPVTVHLFFLNPPLCTPVVIQPWPKWCERHWFGWLNVGNLLALVWLARRGEFLGNNDDELDDLGHGWRWPEFRGSEIRVVGFTIEGVMVIGRRIKLRRASVWYWWRRHLSSEVTTLIRWRW